MTGQRGERMAEAGADVLRIAGTDVLVVLDDAPGGFPWEHPAWALCRGLRSLGFGRVELGRSAEHVGDLSMLMPGEFGFEEDLERFSFDDAELFGVVLHLGGGSEARRVDTHGLLSVRWTGTGVEMLSPGADGVTRAKSAFDAEPLAPVARIAGGLVLQEALISAGQLAGATPAAPSVSYDVAASERTSGTAVDGWHDAVVENAIIEVVGAGAVATHLLESIVPTLGRGCELRIFDFDEVGPENLGVQPAFSEEDIGRPKAVAMVQALSQFSDPELDLRALPIRYEERSGLSRPSLRIACPDTFAARWYVNDCSLRDGVPLVEAGSSPLAAQVRAYLPGETACLEHRIPRLAALARQENDDASCALDRALTLPGTNMVCGGILAAEALRALDPDRFGPPTRSTIAYDARFPERFGLVDARPPCTHHV